MNSSSREDLTTKLKTIRRNFVGNAYDLDEIDVDSIHELKIKMIKIWELTSTKLKRQLKWSLKLIRLVFIGEPPHLMQVVHWEIFSHCASMLLQEILCRLPTVPLLYYMKKIKQWWLWEVWSIIALALIYGCSGPRNMQESLVCALLDLPINDENIGDIPYFDIQIKLQELSSCADEDTFQNALNAFPEDIQ